MGILRDILKDQKLPKFYNVRNNLDNEHIADVAEGVREALKRPGTLDIIEPGKTICFTASSREISNSALILRTLVEESKRIGAIPYVVPAMGSHGGATAEGQLALLEKYGLTEETVGCPIHSTMETVLVGTSKSGLPVRIDKFAASCDYIIPTGRIKPHTDFYHDIESGIMKMIAIGLGNQYGAEICHQLGMITMGDSVLDFGLTALASEKINIPFCFAIVENAFHNTRILRAIPNQKVEEEEKELLVIAKENVPGIPFEKVDVLVIDQIGKEISGDGMDPNVTGRHILYPNTKPFIQRIAVLNLSEKTGDSAVGVGLANAVTKKIFDKMSFETTYSNVLTSRVPEGASIPLVMDTDKLCIQACMQTCWGVPEDLGWRIVWIKDTLHLYDFYISESLEREARNNAQLEVSPEKYMVEFDELENFKEFKRI
ncbi:MAG TPA: DUF2088 domain-containing protein [Clostridiaceae bacterium]|nr:DUF2088 domain-containing protein [Clostridiaceae bacterium]